MKKLITVNYNNYYDSVDPQMGFKEISFNFEMQATPEANRRLMAKILNHICPLVIQLYITVDGLNVPYEAIEAIRKAMNEKNTQISNSCGMIHCYHNGYITIKDVK